MTSIFKDDPRVCRKQADHFEVTGPGGVWDVVLLPAPEFEAPGWIACPPMTKAPTTGGYDCWAALPRFCSADEAIASVIGDPRER